VQRDSRIFRVEAADADSWRSQPFAGPFTKSEPEPLFGVKFQGLFGVYGISLCPITRLALGPLRVADV
jgi:hypothetical protein